MILQKRQTFTVSGIIDGLPLVTPDRVDSINIGINTLPLTSPDGIDCDRIGIGIRSSDWRGHCGQAIREAGTGIVWTYYTGRPEPSSAQSRQRTSSSEQKLDYRSHCIDFLRQSALCHADTGLITYEWHPTSRIPLANITRHQCVDWGKLSGWVEQRSVDMLRPGWLIHPTLGAAYPDGEGDRIGVVGD
ncbi:hypothetical protein M409DRAFT_58362 [Zasmidium cellare ATCC 36951]|uniref:Uncharacterized protein n=1 Tax=Zasmidium cellare ATCC 36951 TaxID=1080233 RepID=A0A6A6C7M0_ZASCE|nr:uncharacterized protein M409DRAFT_58362 [Zasmidium cellare ATCC 36951]KAF2162248.1 hypothetical protein M409DRAFT_58362 [Zasmidium cellare ATCC 36951]